MPGVATAVWPLITDDAAAAAPMLAEAGAAGAGVGVGVGVDGAEVFAVAAVSSSSAGLTFFFGGVFSEEAVSVSDGWVFLCRWLVPVLGVVVALSLSDAPAAALSFSVLAVLSDLSLLSLEAVFDFLEPDSSVSAVEDAVLDFFDSVPPDPLSVLAVGALVVESVVAVL